MQIGSGGGISEAPTDGQQYGRQSSAWSVVTPNPTWTTLSGKPSTFPPTLPIAESDVTNLVTDLAAKAALASPVFTGDPQAPTPATNDNDQSIATTQFVQTAIATAGVGQTLYYDLTDAANVSGYKRLLLTPSSGAESTAAVSCSGTGDVLIASFVTDPGIPGAINFPAGTAYRRLYGMVSTGTARFHLQVYIRTVAGAETLVRDEFSPNFSDTTVALQEWLATPASGGTMQATDRIVNKISAQRVSGPTNITVTFFAEGSAHASQLQTTIPPGASAPLSVTPPLVYSSGNISISGVIRYDTAQTLTVPQQTQARDNILAVARSGDTMTGQLTLNYANPTFVLQKTAAAQNNQIAAYNGANLRWVMQIGNATAESGSNAGSNFSIDRYSDAGAFIDSPLFIVRASSAASFSGSVAAVNYSPKAGIAGGFFCKTGDTMALGANQYNFYWTGSAMAIYVDAAYIGAMSYTSDYRIKKDVEALPSTWETVKALRPIKYTQAEFSPPGHQEKAKADGKHLFEADEIERWGFIAHELQEATIESAATGVKDQDNCIQSPNPFTIIAALTKALQEAMTRIEALEAK